LPGLHDHHLHFFALAAARASVDCSGCTLDQLRERIADHPQQGWLRLVNWDEAYLPNLDAPMLETLSPGRPVRAQHRSGKVWVLNNTACEMLNLSQVPHEGVERDTDGKITGRLLRMDRWLAEQLSPATLPVHELSRELHSYGITGFTDTSFTNNQARVDALHELPFDVYAMGDDTLRGGHLKIMLDDDNLPALENVVSRINAARHLDRGVAFHCVSAVECLFALNALQIANPREGGLQDRIEHGGVIPRDVYGQIRDLDLVVVTQPGFLRHRGQRFVTHMHHSGDPVAWLYPYRSLLGAGIGVAASSDAPYGPVNPWQVIDAATARVSEVGQPICPEERVSAEEALRGYLSAAHDPAGPARTLDVGGPATLCVLSQSDLGGTSLKDPQVQLTLRNGERLFEAGA